MLAVESAEPLRVPMDRLEAYSINTATVTTYISQRTIEVRYRDASGHRRKTEFEMDTSEAYSLKDELGKAMYQIRQARFLAGEFTYAGFWGRFVASLLDSIILSIIGWILGFILSFLPFWFGTAISIGYAIGSIVYYPGFWVWKGATPGKTMMGVKIVKADGSPIGIGRAIARYFSYFISIITLGAGYLMIAWDSKKQGLHDKIAGTYVVEVP